MGTKDDLKVVRINNIIHGNPINENINQDGLGRYIFNLMKDNAKKVVQVNAVTGEEESYEEFNKKCIRVALELKKRGVKEDDVVLQISENNMITMIPIVATLYLNAIIASFDPSMSLAEMTHLLKLVKPKVIFSVYESRKTIRQAITDTKINALLIIMDHTSDNNEPTISDFFLPNPMELQFVPKVVDDITKTALILFSSGTTGLSKPMKCSHYGLLYTVTGELMCGYECDVIMHYNSFYWISPYLLTLFTFINGGMKVIPKAFDPETALEYFRKYKVTTILLPTTFMHKFTEENTELYRNTKYPKHLIYGGSGTSSSTIKKVNSYFPYINLYFVYGLSEVSGFVTGFPKKYYYLYRNKPGTIGLPNPGVSIKIADTDTGKPLPPNESGEIRISTKGIFNGYGTSNSENTLDEDGYLKTGDIGYYDEDHCLYVTDRVKEMFKYQSWPILPMSLEAILYKHPGIQEVVVIGIPHEDDGHHPMAVVVLHDNYPEIKNVDIESFFNEQVIDREKLRAGVVIVKRLSKTTSGKIMRNEIRRLILEGKVNRLM